MRDIIVAYPLDEIWPVVLPRITAIRERYRDHADWTEADVYQACSGRKAFLFSNTGDSSFAVVYVKKRNGEDILFVWLACGENGARDVNIGFLKNIARNVGATSIEMESPRHGFDRMAGWKRMMTTYRMEV